MSNILVIGDLIIDEYIYGEAVGVSLESPTLKCVYNKSTKLPGGSGNLVMNLCTLKQAVTYVTVCTDSTIRDLLLESNVNLYDNTTYESINKTSVKQRFYVERKDSKYKYLQLNYDHKIKNSYILEDVLMLNISDLISSGEWRSVILSDYRTGFMTDRFCRFIINVCNDHNITTFVNTQISDWGNKRSLYMDKFNNSSYIICNDDEEKYIDNLDNTIVTLGEHGSRYSDITVPGYDIDIVDTCGAGDSYVAMASTLDWSSKNIEDNLYKCNIWAGLSCKELGAKPPCYREFNKCWNNR